VVVEDIDTLGLDDTVLLIIDVSDGDCDTVSEAGALAVIETDDVSL
jgi:hypothetical protein